MSRLADEIGRMAEQIREVDAALGQTLTDAATLDARTLQRVDHIRQEIEGLQHYVRVLTASINPDGSCDPASASQGLALRAQVLRLRGLQSEEPSDDLW